MTTAIAECRPVTIPPPCDYHARILAYSGTGATLAAGVYSQALPAITLWALPYLLLYPHLARALGRPTRRNRRLSFTLDAMNGGAVIALTDFSPIPCLMLMLVLGFSALLTSKQAYLPMILGVTTGSALLCAMLIPIQRATPHSAWFDLTSILSAALYICISAHHVCQRGRHLARSHAEIEAKQARAVCIAKYLSPQIRESIFNGRRTTRLETQRRKLTVFFSDIKGFSELSEEMEAEALTDMLNHYLREMSKITHEYGGTLDKFVGDCIMVFFGDPTSQGARLDATAAVSMALAMRERMKALRRQWRARGIDCSLEIRMGIHTGYCSVGNFGTETRMDYTVIGREVNLASRLEAAAEAGEILISHKTYALVRRTIRCRKRGQVSGKGIARPIQAYQVIGPHGSLDGNDSFIEHDMPGFSLYLDANGILHSDKERIIDALQQASRKLQGDLLH
ncbi:adenylate cyclase [Pseudomonas sp. ABC1]|uniref:adenylate/guanylate cyclase domain-containing protein n=1 Tax=Pseudomonas sp. ABC1 TaxID=2748080 RepID=UPI0015C2FA35|nr:adenylate/guanylate cyclase domain-containing protein [Pseudomonas sp. ABC1]QLF91893.1 adenylate cyclase [Pseudomonas sp. ABC1]